MNVDSSTIVGALSFAVIEETLKDRGALHRLLNLKEGQVKASPDVSE